jgi:comEA protein
MIYAAYRLWPGVCIEEERKEVIMTRLTAKAMLIGLVLGLIVSPLVSAQTAAKAGDKVNINTASLAELQKLPRIGPQIAQRILDYRKENGNFKKIEEILKVRGIGEKVFSQLKDLITVGAEAASK